MTPAPGTKCQAAGSIGQGAWKACGQNATTLRYLQLNGWVIIMNVCDSHRELWDLDIPEPWLCIIPITQEGRT